MKAIRNVFLSFVLVAGFSAALMADEPAKKKKSTPNTTGKGGSQLWAETCHRCHFIRPPDAHSDGEWEIIMTQMRFMANLTDEQYIKILAFLKSAN